MKQLSSKISTCTLYLRWNNEISHIKGDLFHITTTVLSVVAIATVVVPCPLEFRRDCTLNCTGFLVALLPSNAISVCGCVCVCVCVCRYSVITTLCICMYMYTYAMCGEGGTTMRINTRQKLGWGRGGSRGNGAKLASFEEIIHVF